MFVILGASGHVGSAVINELLQAGEAVTAVLHDEEKAAPLRSKGAEVAVLDVRDVASLRSVLEKGRRAFLLNPPAPVSGDTDNEERQTATAIAQALSGTNLEKVVVQSTYGAQPGRGKGDLSVLYEFEEAVRALGMPTTVQRAAYYMSNYDAMIEPARQGILHSMFPADFQVPMVAPADLGVAAARFLREPSDQTGIRYVEGPTRYTPRDVADAFAAALDSSVEVVVTLREGWIDAFEKIGFSKEAAKSYAGMTTATIDGAADVPTDAIRGKTTLTGYIKGLIRS